MPLIPVIRSSEVSGTTPVTQTFTHIYNVRNSVTATYTHRYNIRNVITQTFTHLYKILELIYVRPAYGGVLEYPTVSQIIEKVPEIPITKKHFRVIGILEGKLLIRQSGSIFSQITILWKGSITSTLQIKSQGMLFSNLLIKVQGQISSILNLTSKGRLESTLQIKQKGNLTGAIDLLPQYVRDSSRFLVVLFATEEDKS